MSYGSFDTAIARSKLSYAEKYGKAKIEDLNLFKEVLGAEVVMAKDGSAATIHLGNQSISIRVE